MLTHACVCGAIRSPTRRFLKMKSFWNMKAVVDMFTIQPVYSHYSYVQWWWCLHAVFRLEMVTVSKWWHALLSWLPCTPSHCPHWLSLPAVCKWEWGVGTSMGMNVWVFMGEVLLLYWSCKFETIKGEQYVSEFPSYTMNGLRALCVLKPNSWS